jgi:Resolvase, N terminal domain
MVFCDPKMTGCSSIRSQLICDELVWDKAIFLQKLAHEFQRGALVPFRLDQHIEDLALGVDGSFRSLHDTWADTTTAHGRLMLTVLGGLAEFERELIRARTGEGRTRAKAQGVKMGRKPKLTDHQKREAIRRRDHGDETLAEIGRSYNVSGWTISRLIP